MRASKEKRIKMLEECLGKLEVLSDLYDPWSPAGTLIQASWAYIHTVHHLESEITFEKDLKLLLMKKRLGVTQEDD